MENDGSEGEKSQLGCSGGISGGTSGGTSTTSGGATCTSGAGGTTSAGGEVVFVVTWYGPKMTLSWRESTGPSP